MPARPPFRRWHAAIAVTVAGLLLASCTSDRPHTGSGTVSEGTGGVATITITTGPDLRFHPSTITVHPGPVRLVLSNQVQGGAGPPHNLQFDDFSAGFVPLVRAGQERSVTFTAPTPGRYRFVCTIHAAQGQNGVMVVTG